MCSVAALWNFWNVIKHEVWSWKQSANHELEEQCRFCLAKCPDEIFYWFIMYQIVVTKLVDLSGRPKLGWGAGICWIHQHIHSTLKQKINKKPQFWSPCCCVTNEVWLLSKKKRGKGVGRSEKDLWDKYKAEKQFNQWCNNWSYQRTAPCS